jgi:hypothetical protein
MNDVAFKTASVGQTRGISGTTGTSATVILTVAKPAQRSGPASAPPSRDVEGAVYTYLRAMRALKQTHVTPDDVASALGISLSSAMAALTSLKSKGVRRSK